MLSILIWLPAAAALVGALIPARRVAGLLALGGALGSLGITIGLIAGYSGHSTRLTHVTNVDWIRSLGIHYSLGLDGLNLFLVAMTTFSFVLAIAAANLRDWERSRVFFLLFALAESAVLGTFLAQDLALFVAFFDLMLIPFYLLLGVWGGPNRIAATLKLVLYTFVGSLLMLAGAIALAVLTSEHTGHPISFALSTLAASPLHKGTQEWIFLLFAAAFLVKMPAFPLHGWMPDAYREMPVEVLAVFSGVLSKVGAYGFLRIVLPTMPAASVHFQTLILLISLASVIYGSAMAFTQTNARLIAGYSSIAQLGFITLGIFAFADQGAQGAVLQMVNHGIVVAPLFLIIGLLAARAGGSDDIRDMGGIATRAPILATCFLIVTFATLAMPGSGNFVGEFLILLGLFKTKMVFSIIAFTGVVMASVYALRVFIRAMHNRVGPQVHSREISLRYGLVLAPFLAAIALFAVYPQLQLGRSEKSVTAAIAHEKALTQTYDTLAGAMGEMIAAAAQLHGPHIDWAALSPLEALIGGSVIVLLTGLLRQRFIREQVVPALTVLSLGATIGLTLWQWHTHVAAISGALAIDDLALIMTLLFAGAGLAATLLSWRGLAPRVSAHGDFYALMLGSIAGMFVLVAAQNIITLFIGLELLSIPLYVLCATEMHRAASLESGLKYLIIGSVGSATLVYGLALIYGATGATDFSAIAASISHGHSSDTLLLTGVALVLVGLCFKASIAPFHQWTPDVYEGAPTPVTAFMAVATKAAAFGVLLRVLDVMLIGERSNWKPALAALATVTIIVGNVGALGQASLKRMLAYSSVAQAGYILAGVTVATELGARATLLYLIVYLLMNIAAFAVIIARERATPYGDDIDAVAGLGAESPWLAWPLTIAMLALAGIPATAGFIGKFFLISALVSGGYTWLAIVLVVGSMISLAYYLRVIAAVWMRPAPGPSITTTVGVPIIAGGSPEADVAAGQQLELTFVAIVFAAATVFFGIVPQPLFDLVQHSAHTLSGAL